MEWLTVTNALLFFILVVLFYIGFQLEQLRAERRL
jgi:hypothetical protein